MLDESLWMATSAPIEAFRCDPGFIEQVNGDGSGRISSDELKSAVRWLLDVLKDTGGICEQSDRMRLDAIDQNSEGGRILRESATHVLATLGEASPDAISLGQVRKYLAVEKEQPLNGDGVLVPEAASNNELCDFIKDAISCIGGTEDAGGRMGITQTQLDQFAADVEGLVSWKEKGGLPKEGESSEMFPFGEETSGVYTVYAENAAEVDLFFDLCRTLAFDPRVANRLNCSDADLQELNFGSVDDIKTCLHQAPLAKPGVGAALPLCGDSVNPLYRDWLFQLSNEVLAKALGESPDLLSEDEWNSVKKMLQPYAAYLDEKQGDRVECLPHAKLLRYGEGDLCEEARKLVEKDKAIADKLKGVRDLERLLLYHEHLIRLANNFVSFSQLYTVEERALFETGAVVIDGRWLDLVVRVADIAKHSEAAKASNIFTIYLEVTDKTLSDKFTVVAPATSGTKGNLTVGKRGVFFDIEGKEYDARIVKIIENPISIREALCAPFARLWGFVLGKIESISGSSEKEMQKSADKLLKAPPRQSGSGALPGGPAGLLVGLSVSAAAIGSAFAFITKTFSSLRPGQALLGLAGAAVCVGVPVAVTAIMKLRRQDLSSLLEGCGWAVNARMRLNPAQRRQFTRKPGYPTGATGVPRYRRTKIAAAIFLILLLAATVTSILRRIGDERSEKAPEESSEKVEVEASEN